jgi:hypothetical protein
MFCCYCLPPSGGILAGGNMNPGTIFGYGKNGRNLCNLGHERSVWRISGIEFCFDGGILL